jgi:glycosyltransferase involved in cell wall biosynthesis
MADGRPKLVVISAVHPFPGHSGQQRRVKNTLLALRKHFHTTFLTFATADDTAPVGRDLGNMCDEAIVLPSLYRRSAAARLFHGARSVAHAVITGLKRSNSIVGELELTPERIRRALGDRRYDVALFEYWHASAAVPELRDRGALCVLDMHDVLWQSYDRQLSARRWLPSPVRKWAVARYRRREERAWRAFDVIISINSEEDRHVREGLGREARVILTPMGIDLERWPYCWSPVQPPRVVFYGGLGSPHNQRDARHCYEHIMPLVWFRIPEAELWIVGSNPPPEIHRLEAADPRVRVTGYVEEIAPLLATMSVLLCPWQGTYGFRSRLVEAMAVGVPVVASPDAIDGMELFPSQDLFEGNSAAEIADHVVGLLEDGARARELSADARRAIERRYSFDSTYGALARDLGDEIRQKQASGVRSELMESGAG